MTIASLPSGSKILSFAAAQPSTSLTSEDLGRRYGKGGEWVHERTGIDSLRRLDAAEHLDDHAVAAAREAIRRAGLEPPAIDLLITATCSADMGPGGTIADRVATALQIPAARMNVNAACAGFCYALSAADSFVRTGSARTVLVVAAEQMSRLLDADDLGTSIIFGDGAGAAVVTAGEDRAIGPMVAGSDGAQSGLIAMDRGDYLRMAGRDVFRWAVELLPGLARDACQRAGVRLDDIDVLVPHQANARIIEAARKRMALRADARVLTDIAESGNTSAASIPIALGKLHASGRARRGALALLVGFGAGLTYAAQVVVLP